MQYLEVDGSLNVVFHIPFVSTHFGPLNSWNTCTIVIATRMLFFNETFRLVYFQLYLQLESILRKCI